MFPNSVVTSLVLLVAAMAPCSSQAQIRPPTEVSVTTQQLRRLLQSANLIPIEKSELARRVRTAQDAQGPAFSSNVGLVTYVAGFTPEKGLSGTFDGQIEHSKDSPALVPLGTPGFDSFDFEDGVRAGRSSTNDLFLATERTAFKGKWSCSGQERVWGYEFQLRPFSAATSQLQLTLPPGTTLQSNGTVLKEPRSGTEPQRWTLLLRDGGATSLALLNAAPVNDSAPLIDHRVTWTIRPEALDFRADYQIQTQIPLSGLIIPLPPGSNIESVRYGDSSALAIDIVRAPAGRLLQVRLPARLNGPSRTLIVSGRAPASVGTPWNIPALAPRESVAEDGSSIPVTSGRVTHRLRVSNPLEVKTLSLDGYQQTDSVFNPDGSHTLGLNRTRSDAVATIQVAQPRPNASLSEITRVAPTPDGWTTNTVLQSGTVLPAKVSVRVPGGFSPVSVTTGIDATPCPFESKQTQGQQVLEIRVPPTESRTLRIRGLTSQDLVLPLASGRALSNNSIAIVPQSAAVNTQPDQRLLLSTVQARIREPGNSLPVAPTDTILDTARRPIVLPRPSAQVRESNSNPQPPMAEPAKSAKVHVAVETTLANGDTPDRHRALIEVSAGNDFRFELAPSAKILEVRVNNVKTRAIRSGGRVRVSLEPARQNLITILYQSRQRSPGLLSTTRQIPLPVVQQPAGFLWTVRLPSGLRMLSCSSFGPQDATDRHPTANLLGPFGSRATPQEQFTSVPFPFLPKSLTIQTSYESTNRTHQWIAFAGFALIGSLFSVNRQRLKRLCLIAGLLAFLGCATPGATGAIFGSAFLGLVVPISLGSLMHRNPRGLPSGSRVSVASAVAVVLALLANLADASQDSPVRVYRIGSQETVYAPKAFLDKLDLATNSPRPDYLLQSARYEVDAESESVTINATFMVIRAGGLSFEVQLPFGNANPDQCTVDGEDAVFRKDGDNILIALPEPPGDEEQDQVLETPLSISVRLRPATQNGEHTLPIPPATNSVASGSGDGVFLLNGTLLSDTPVSVAEELHLARKSATMAASTTSRSDLVSRNECNVVLGPDGATLQHQLSIDPGVAPLHHIDLAFPSTHQFVALQTSQPCRQRVFRAGRNGYIALDFDRPVTDSVEVTVQLSDKVNRELVGRRIRLQRLMPSSQSAESVRITADPRLKINQLRVLSEKDGAVISEPEPNDGGVGLALSETLTIELDVTPLQTKRDAWLSHQLQLGADRIDYTLQASVQVINGPVFEHTLELSEDLRIDSVTVRENQVDRLARYQRSGNLLVLLLDGRTSGIQEITVEAHKRVSTTGTATTLPTITVEAAMTQDSSLSISREASVEATILRGDGTPGGSVPEESDVTFDLTTEAIPEVTIAQQKPMQVRELCLVGTDRSGQLQATWIAELQGHSNATRFTADLQGLRVTNTKGIKQHPSDSGTEFEVTDETSRITFEATALDGDTFARPAWSGDTQVTSTLVAIAKTTPVELDRAQCVATPEWVSSLVPDNHTVLDVSGVALKIRPTRQTEKPLRLASIRQVEHHVWQQHGRVAGRTEIFTSARGELQFDLLEHKVLSVSVDGVFVAPDSRGPGNRLAVENDQSRVSIVWTIDTQKIIVPSLRNIIGEQFVVVQRTESGTSLAAGSSTSISTEEFVTRRENQVDPVPVTNAAVLVSDITQPGSVSIVPATSVASRWLSAATVASLVLVFLFLIQQLPARIRVSLTATVLGALAILFGSTIAGIASCVIALIVRVGLPAAKAH